MTSETLENLKNNWKPITLQLSSGSTIVVKHPDYFITSPTLKIVVIFNEPEGTKFTIVDVDKIVRIDREK